MFREELHPRDAAGRFADIAVRSPLRSRHEKRRADRIDRIKDALPSLTAEQRLRLATTGMPSSRRGPSPAQTETELTLARTFGFTRPLGKDANGNYLVAAGGQRHSINQAGKIVGSARIDAKLSPGHTLAVPRPVSRGTVDAGAYRPRRVVRHEIHYIDPPTVPPGMTLPEYRRARGRTRGKAHPGVDWKSGTAAIPAFGGEEGLGRISDQALRNLLSLRGLPAPRKAQVSAEIKRRRKPVPL